MAQDKRNLTKAIIDALPPADAGKRYFVFDAEVRGLAIRVTDKGVKGFYLYRWSKDAGKPIQMKLGPYPDMPIRQARDKANEGLNQLANDVDPSEKRREARHAKTFGELFEWYVEQPKKNGERGARTVAEYRKLVSCYLGPLVGRVPAQIKPTDVEALFQKVGKEHGRYAANRMLALMRAVFNRAIKKGLMKGANPAAGVEAFAEHRRDRRLQPHEIARFLAAVAEEPSADIRDYVLISLYTGARKTNVLEARWEQVDIEGRTWRIPVTKNGTSQTVPLEDAEIEILTRRKLASASPWVFPGVGASGHLADPKAGWARILATAGIVDLRIHDLRRSLASFMVDSGASLPVVGKALHHQSQATTAIYARLSLDPVREAKRAAHGAIHAAIHAATSNVIPIAAAPSAPAPAPRSRRPAARR